MREVGGGDARMDEAARIGEGLRGEAGVREGMEQGLRLARGGATNQEEARRARRRRNTSGAYAVARQWAICSARGDRYCLWMMVPG